MEGEQEREAVPQLPQVTSATSKQLDHDDAPTITLDTAAMKGSAGGQEYALTASSSSVSIVSRDCESPSSTNSYSAASMSEAAAAISTPSRITTHSSGATPSLDTDAPSPTGETPGREDHSKDYSELQTPDTPSQDEYGGFLSMTEQGREEGDDEEGGNGGGGDGGISPFPLATKYRQVFHLPAQANEPGALGSLLSSLNSRVSGLITPGDEETVPARPRVVVIDGRSLQKSVGLKPKPKRVMQRLKALLQLCHAHDWHTCVIALNMWFSYPHHAEGSTLLRNSDKATIIHLDRSFNPTGIAEQVTSALNGMLPMQ